MVLFGNRYETPTVLPNRTTCAAKDISHLLSLLRAKCPTDHDIDLFQLCVAKFKELSFSEIMKPLSDSLEVQAKSDIFELFTSIILLSLRSTDPAIEPLQVRILVYLLHIFLTCQNSTEARIPPTLPTTPETPTGESALALLPVEPIIFTYKQNVSITDIRKMTEIVSHFPKSSLVCQIIKYFHSNKLYVPKSHSPNFYIDHTGIVSLRNNAQDTVAKVVTRGEETGRTVSVVEGLDGYPVLVNSVGEVIFEPAKQTTHGVGLKEEVQQIMRELGNIIPLPIDSDLGQTASEEEQLDASVAMLPPDSIRMLLKDGRIRKRKRRLKKE